MKFSSKQYAQALMEAIDGAASSDQDQILDNFVKVMAENNDIRLFEQIASEFHKLELAKKGIKQAEITTARPSNHENDEKILHELNKLVSGKVELKKKIDDRIIGGVIVRMEDQMLDASVKSNLEQLKRDLTQ